MLYPALVCLVVGIVLAFLFVGALHALGIALIVVGVLLLLFALLADHRSRREPL